MKPTFKLIATAAAGLEAVVGRELRDLGYDCQVEKSPQEKAQKKGQHTAL